MFSWEFISVIVGAAFASTGFWTLVTNIYNRHSDKQSAETRLLLGLAHNVIFNMCERYLERGYITPMEYDDLLFIYQAYEQSGGNGTGKILFDRVSKLPIKELMTEETLR